MVVGKATGARHPVRRGDAALACPSVIDVRLLRTDPDLVRRALARRSSELLIALDEAEAADSAMRVIARQRDETRHRIKELSQQVGQLRRQGDAAGAEALMAQSRSLGDDERALDERSAQVEAQLREVMLRLPNLPHPDAPDGLSDADNPLVKGPVAMPADWADYQRFPHWDTAVELGILDNERATKIAKSMFTLQRGAGAALGRSLCQLALDSNADAFEEIRPPSLVSTATLTATGHLPKFANDAFAVERDDLWLIPTGEVPLTSMYAGEVLDMAELPKRLMAFTPCFRREAGSAGRDTRGMLRTHEFDKVEILALTTAEQAPVMLEELVGRAERLIASLGLTYRIIEICTGDMGQSHHRSFDLEVYAPGVDTWLEVSSVSWFSDYQARRADIRYRVPGEKGTHLVHTLNGSALAVPRVWAAIVETFRQADGSVLIPEVLRPYLRGRERIERPA
jgi:seryl-tRNA synthetase